MDAVRLTDDQMRDIHPRRLCHRAAQPAPGTTTMRCLPRSINCLRLRGTPATTSCQESRNSSTAVRRPRDARGALASIMGDDYYLEPHRFVHFNQPHSKGQTLHKDSFTRRRHHTRWLVTFYYPQDTPLEMGPTGVVPGTQYTNVIPEDSYDREIGACGRRGTGRDSELRHRASRNAQPYRPKAVHGQVSVQSHGRAYVAPSWDNEDAEWGEEDGENSGLLSHIMGLEPRRDERRERRKRRIG